MHLLLRAYTLKSGLHPGIGIASTNASRFLYEWLGKEIKEELIGHDFEFQEEQLGAGKKKRLAKSAPTKFHLMGSLVLMD